MLPDSYRLFNLVPTLLRGNARGDALRRDSPVPHRPTQPGLGRLVMGRAWYRGERIDRRLSKKVRAEGVTQAVRRAGAPAGKSWQ